MPTHLKMYIKLKKLLETILGAIQIKFTIKEQIGPENSLTKITQLVLQHKHSLVIFCSNQL